MDDPYTRVSSTILHQLSTADPATWVCPWHRAHGGRPRNALTSHSYRGINTVALWCRAQTQGYADARWATYRQWAQLGAQVRRGEQGSPVLFYRDLPPETARAAGNDDAEAPRFVARASPVFNAAQVDGAAALPALRAICIDPTPTFDRFVTATNAVVRAGDAACYLPARDEIRMPDRAVFRSVEGYCGTLAHELVHWTGAPHRLDRQLTTRFRARAYAAEELVAELGSAFVLAGLGIAPEPHPNHAAYMASWLPVLRDDPRALVTAASLASKAAQFLEAFSQPVAISRGRGMTSDPSDPDATSSGPTDGSSLRSPTRRTLLTLLAAMPILPTEASNSTETSCGDANPLSRLFCQFEAITAALERALARVDRLEARLVAEIGHPRVQIPSSLGETARYAADPWCIDRAKLPHRQAHRLKRLLHRRQRIWNAAALDLGLTDAVHHEEQVARAVRAICAVLLATPATNSRAVSLKLLVLIALHQPGPAFAGASPWRELRLILADVARLMGEGFDRPM